MTKVLTRKSNGQVITVAASNLERTVKALAALRKRGISTSISDTTIENGVQYRIENALAVIDAWTSAAGTPLSLEERRKELTSDNGAMLSVFEKVSRELAEAAAASDEFEEKNS